MELKAEISWKQVIWIGAVLAGLALVFLLGRWTSGGGKVPPGPGPGPAPTPGPGPLPIPVPQMRVLIVEETAERSKLPAPQLAALFSEALYDYLSARCVPGPDGKTPEWRVFDKDADLSRSGEAWRKAFARERKSLPWLVILSGETSVFEGPLPGNLPDLLALLKRFGG